ncbi:DENN domain-containing protein 2C-like isoform X1 [Asterias rubens]|uniref:DENN domain-containing protein 2C-like isoform X1 n=1 Tax=Asterias rubens TaxID=7604 RepID=UPI001455405E|nr:DENN domain-containing protein 2C-like isoform X1 [Asterias rubens]
MTSRAAKGDSKPPVAAQREPPLGPAKLKDRIHLFEGLTAQSNGNAQKNTSSNNTEEVLFVRHPKVVSLDQKRWTQIEVGAADSKVTPWLQQRMGKGTVGGRPDVNQNSPSEVKNVKPPLLSPNRSKTLGQARNRSPIDKPLLPSKPTGLTLTTKGHFLFGDFKDGNSTSSPKPKTAPEDRHSSNDSDLVYIKGTPVKLRNNRKSSSDSSEVRNSVLLMVNNFENKEDTNGTNIGHEKKVDIRRQSADVNRGLRNETRTKGEFSSKESKEEDSFQFTRRRSKSFSHYVPSASVKPQGPPAKPQRTFEHDIYMETKKVLTQKNPQDRLTSTPVESTEHNEDDDDKDYLLLTSCSSPPKRPSIAPPPPPSKTQDQPPTKTSPAGLPVKTKKLPDIPNVAPYSPKQPRIPRNIKKYEVDRRSSPSPPSLVLTPTEERPRSESALVSSSRNPPSRLRDSHRSFSSEDVSKFSSHHSPGKVNPKLSSEYAEPVVPDTIKQAVSEECLFLSVEDQKAIVDSEGYSIPGSHLWKKPQPVGEKRALSLLWKSTPTSRHTVDISDLSQQQSAVHQKLTRVRKTSSNKKEAARHTYTEPGTHLEDEHSETPLRQRSRLVTMRRKINDAFRRPTKTVKSHIDDDRASVNSGGSETEVDEEVMHKRLTHARAVKKRSSVYCNASKYRRIVQEAKLYDYLVVISLEFNEETRRYQPVEKYRYPEEVSASQNDKLRAIPHFCFPDAFKWAPVEEYQSESYSFVLTSIDGSRLYGYNRRLLPPGDKPRLPEVYCIITPVSCRLLFTQLLDEIEKRRMISKRESSKLISEAYKRHVPPPGGTTTIMQMETDGKTSSVMKPLRLQRPQDSRLEHVDFDCLFSSLKIPQVIQIFASLLLERRVIMCSGKLSKLSKCSQAVAALLYPFGWQHVYVPVLPEKLIDMACSPTPYIMGMLSLCIPKLDELPIDEVLIVDLDSKDFYTVVGDEETILPKKLALALERALEIILSFSILDANSGEEDELSSEDQESKNKAVSEVFIHFFVETCGHYTNHFSSNYDGSLKFDREAFIKVVGSRSVRRFLEVFTETQMFSLFIQEKEAEVEGIAQGLFETRFREWEAECKLNQNKFGAKVKKIGRAVKGISRDGGHKIAGTAKDVRIKVKANLDTKV